MTTDNHNIQLSAHKTARLLVIVTVVLVLLSMSGNIIFYTTGHNDIYGLIDLFNVEKEGNIPTFFSSSLLLSAALVLALIALLKRKTRDAFGAQWALLALAFLYLAVDEAAFIHELFYRPMEEILGDRAADSSFAFWVIPGIVFVLALLGLFVKFWRHLDNKTRRLFLLSFCVYFGGAIGMEIVSSYYLDLFYTQIDTNVLPQVLIYDLLTSVEEMMEMLGVIVMIYASMKYIEDNYREIRLSF